MAELDPKEAIVPDPHTVFLDAIQHSPWGDEADARLPSRGEWSTFRYATKDIVLGVITHRDNRTEQRLDIRAYFVGEHPLFKEFEPTKAVLIILMCQCYMTHGRVELFFENRIPFDVRSLVERELGVYINGHEKSLSRDLCHQLFPALSRFPKWAIDRMDQQKVATDKVCFFAYRGVWATENVISILRRRIPLVWLYTVKPSLLSDPLQYLALEQQLVEVLTEQYAIERLRDRKMGASWGHRIKRISDCHSETYVCETTLEIDDGESRVYIEAEKPFSIFTRSQMIRSFQTDSILCFPFDRKCDTSRFANHCAVGISEMELREEVRLKLAIVADESDENDVDLSYNDRFAD